MVDLEPGRLSSDVDVSPSEHRLTSDDIQKIINAGRAALAGSRAGEESRSARAKSAETRLLGVKDAVFASQTGWFGFSRVKK